MFVVKRNQIIIAALVVMIAVAGYLNYADGNRTKTVLEEEDNTIEALVPNEESIMLSLIQDEDEQGIALSDEDELGIALSDEGDLINITNETAKKDTDKEEKSDEKTITKDSEKKEIEKNSSDTDDSSAKKADDPGAAIFVNASSDSTYFIQAKLDREQARSREREILTELINNKNLDKEQRSKSADAMLDIQKRIEKETSAEAMIESKGFSEVYVRIDDKTVDVVVNKETLSEVEIAQIEDIVKRKTGVAIENIRISPLKIVGD